MFKFLNVILSRAFDFQAHTTFHIILSSLTNWQTSFILTFQQISRTSSWGMTMPWLSFGQEYQKMIPESQN
jgi:hypothetical protein